MTNTDPTQEPHQPGREKRMQDYLASAFSRWMARIMGARPHLDQEQRERQ